jgi:Na+/H+-dicarboxylate symporter
MSLTWKDVAIGACIVVAGVIAYVFIGLDKRVDDQRKQIEQLSRQFSILVGVISTKMPSANIPALISTAAKNNVSPEEVSVVVPLLSSDPIQAKVYLKSQLKFNENEINLIMQPTPTKSDLPSIKKQIR